MTITAASSSTETLDIDGVPLTSYGWGCETVGDRLQSPPLRGDDAQSAYVAGREWRPKLPDAYVVSLAMWVIGARPDTGAPGPNQALMFNDNWRALRTLLWTPSRQLALTRRWWLTDAGTGLPSLQVATAQCQLASELRPRMTSRTRGQFTCDLMLADPFYYGTEVSTSIAVSTPTTIVNPGDYAAAGRHVEVDLVGPLTNPTLTNSTPSPDVSVTFTGAIASGHTLTLDVRGFSATNSVAVSGSTNRIGGISHAGARQWMGLERGTNTLTLTASAGAGHAVLRYRPPYI